MGRPKVGRKAARRHPFEGRVRVRSGGKRKRPAMDRATPFHAEGFDRIRPPAREGSGSTDSWRPLPISFPMSRQGSLGTQVFTHRVRALAASGGAGSQAGHQVRKAARTVPRGFPPCFTSQMIVGPHPGAEQGSFSGSRISRSCNTPWQIAARVTRNRPAESRSSLVTLGTSRRPDQSRGRVLRAAESTVPRTASAASTVNASCEAATKAARSTGARPPSSTRPACER